jgi:hypothetical protein
LHVSRMTVGTVHANHGLRCVLRIIEPVRPKAHASIKATTALGGRLRWNVGASDDPGGIAASQSRLPKASQGPKYLREGMCEAHTGEDPLWEHHSTQLSSRASLEQV